MTQNSAERRGDSIWERLRSYQKSAELVVLLTVGVVGAAQRLPTLVAGGASTREWLPVVLLGTAIGLSVLWWRDTDGEMTQLRKVAESDVGDLDLPTAGFWVTIAAALLLLALIYASTSPLSFAIVLLALKTTESWGSWLAKLKIRDAIRILRARNLKPVRGHAVDILEAYYLVRPWDQLLTSEMLAAALACVMAAYAERTSDAVLSDDLQAASSSLLALAVVGNEVVAGIWRRDRDGQLPAKYRS